MKITTQSELNIYNRCKQANINEPVSIEELARATGLSDRAVRDAIHRMRENGIRICATASDKGYWLAVGEEDYKVFRRYYMSPAWTTFRTVYAMDNATEGQMEGLENVEN